MILWIKPFALKKLELFYEKADGEISGFGVVKKINGELVVYDVFIFKQECGRASTEVDPSKTLDYIEEHPDSLEDIKLWWHTHKNFDASWSRDDEETIETLISIPDWFISIVIGRDETLARFDMCNPFRITEGDIEIRPRIIFSEDMLKRITKWVEKEIEEKVVEKKYGLATVDYEHLGFKRTDLTPAEIAEIPVCHSIEEFNRRQKELFGSAAHLVDKDAIDLANFPREDCEEEEKEEEKKEEGKDGGKKEGKNEKNDKKEYKFGNEIYYKKGKNEKNDKKEYKFGNKIYYKKEKKEKNDKKEYKFGNKIYYKKEKKEKKDDKEENKQGYILPGRIKRA